MSDKISKHFWRSEFICKDGKGQPCGCDKGRPLIDVELIRVLEDVRAHFNAAVHINSGFRCEVQNYRVGGSPYSRHMEHIAADIRVEGVPASDVQLYLLNRYPNRYGIGQYRHYTHIDIRNKKARW